jgi:hypothetical protein
MTSSSSPDSDEEHSASRRARFVSGLYDGSCELTRFRFVDDFALDSTMTGSGVGEPLLSGVGEQSCSGLYDGSCEAVRFRFSDAFLGVVIVAGSGVGDRLLSGVCERLLRGLYVGSCEVLHF